MTALNELIAERFGIETETGTGQTAEGTVGGILARRTIRKYKPDPVPDELLDILLSGAQSAPAKSDLQQYSIVVLRDPGLRQAIADLDTALWFALAPVALVFCGDMRRGQRIAEMRGHAYENNTVDTFMNAAVDGALAMGALGIAAESLGLGTCCISNVRKHVGVLSDLLGLPEGVYPIAGFAAGWPAEERDMNLRLPAAVVRHQDRYDDSGLEAEIAAYDARRHARRPIPPASQMHTDRYGVAKEYTWSENAARRLSVRERADFTKYLKKQGFALD